MNEHLPATDAGVEVFHRDSVSPQQLFRTSSFNQEQHLSSSMREGERTSVLSDMPLVSQAHWRVTETPALDVWDQQVLTHFACSQPWGMETSIDLLACDPQTIRDPAAIRAFIEALCETIHMRRYGEPLVVHFGAEERVSGYSLVQLIETSDITGHFIEQVDAACLNIFSCASYPPYQVATFCQQWFGAQEVRLAVQFRGPTPADLPEPR